MRSGSIKHGNVHWRLECQSILGLLKIVEMPSVIWRIQYSDETATILAKQLLSGSNAATNICIVSAPSVFVQLKNLIASNKYQASSVCLLEFDNRFDIFREFVHYDFEHPLTLPVDMKGKYDCILCDPPFLSLDCQTKGKTCINGVTEKSVDSSGGSRHDCSLAFQTCVERCKNIQPKNNRVHWRKNGGARS